MFKPILLFTILLSILCSPPVIKAADDYGDHSDLTARLKQLADKYPDYTTLRSLTRTEGEKDIWMLAIGSGDHSSKPAIVIAGGIEGDNLLSTELALSFSENLLGNSGNAEIRELLNENTFYILPDLSPDAREQYFSSLKFERRGNDNSSYTDRYGAPVNHLYRDLNGDGIISLMRIKDPSGDWIRHEEDERVMVNIDKSAGERGEYSVYAEGIDLDVDERWTEAGVSFNRNFSFSYPAFTSGAGEHAMSENETRAVAEFLFDATNVYAVVSFGPADNLSEPLKFDESKTNGRIITGMLADDATVNAMVSKRYGEIMESLPAEGVPGTDGDFFQWAYFHYGRYSFSTQGWTIPGAEPDTAGKIPASDNREVQFLRWAEKESIDNVFIPWESVTHPLYPDLEVEAGGIVPFSMKNPPYDMVPGIAGNHYDFIVELAGMRPAIEITNIKQEQLGNGLYRITADISNRGILPSVSEIGERLRWVPKIVIRVEATNGQEVLSGKSVEVLTSVEGGKKETRSWLVRGRGELKLSAGAENTGFSEKLIKL